MPRIVPGGQLEIVGVTLRELIRMAYPADGGQVLVEGGPAWVTSDRFDVVATTTGGARPSMPMLKRLLAERFKLRVQPTTREGTVFTLGLARRDGALGPLLKPSTCTPIDDNPAFNRDCERAPDANLPPTDCSSLRIGAGPTFFGQSVTMTRFATFLSEFPMLSAPVIDHTGLTGTYDFQMRTRGENNPNVEAGSLMPAALEEQLGLKLERTRGPVTMIVVESVERPEPN
jgi:uncharacterized protein (TIGR03435 family)